MTEKVRMICRYCGSENVMRDAWAIWNVTLQEWELDNVFDAAFCEDCGNPTSIDEDPIREDVP